MLLLAGLLLLCSSASLGLKICSFNVRSFGEAKLARHEVLDVVVKVISRCDIMLLMEIKENNNRICPLLTERLNRWSKGPKGDYSYVVSKRLGRNTYKEQYAFLYRQNLVSVKQVYQYPDLQPGDEDAFSREPFVVWFLSPGAAVKEFAVIPLHTTPETAVREIDELYDVYLDVKQRWKNKDVSSPGVIADLPFEELLSFQNFIFMGDFNAGCSYVPKKQWQNIRLRTRPEFVWLIGDQNDTTVRRSTSCPYDRIVVSGEALLGAVVPHSATVFDFQRAFRLSEEQALGVSDHFPVEFELQPSGGLPAPLPRKRRPRKNRRRPRASRRAARAGAGRHVRGREQRPARHCGENKRSINA